MSAAVAAKQHPSTCPFVHSLIHSFISLLVFFIQYFNFSLVHLFFHLFMVKALHQLLLDHANFKSGRLCHAMWCMESRQSS